jgi:hypothetical protein
MIEEQIQEIQEVRTGSCSSISGRGTIITYATGCKGDSQYIRLVSCSSSAIFCRDWVSMVDIQQLLAGCSKVTSKTLQPLYAGKSSNSAGFMLACINNIQSGSIHTEAFLPAPVPEVTPQKKPAKKNTTPK